MLTALCAQDQRRLAFQIKGTAGDTVFLANYYGNRLYYADTAIADGHGLSVFNSPKGYKTGVYAVVVPGPKYFEIIVNEPEVKISSDTADLTGRLEVERSRENTLFHAYIRTLNEKKKEGDALRGKHDATQDPIARGTLKKQMEDLDHEVKAFQRELVDRNPDTFVARIVKMSMPTPDERIKRPDGTIDTVATYQFYRAHFWDNTDLADERIVRTPVFQNKLEEYIAKVVPQVPDSINRLADALIARVPPGGELFKFVVHSITYKYETSDIMGMDAVFVHMAQTYYCAKPGEKSRAFWMAEEKLKKMCERAKKMAPLVIGAPARDVILPDTTEANWRGFRDLPNDYVYLVFWDPHCGHCKKSLPDIHKQYLEKLRPAGIEVFAIAKATDSTLFADWKKYLRENRLEWVNVGLTWHVYEQARKEPWNFIPQHTTIESLNYADAWDVYSTPKFYLVGPDRKIVGKQINPEQVIDLVGKLRTAKRSE